MECKQVPKQLLISHNFHNRYICKYTHLFMSTQALYGVLIMAMTIVNIEQ